MPPRVHARYPGTGQGRTVPRAFARAPAREGHAPRAGRAEPPGGPPHPGVLGIGLRRDGPADTGMGRSAADG